MPYGAPNANIIVSEDKGANKMKNKIIIRSGSGKEKEIFELYNFSSMTYVYDEDGMSFIRIECEGRFYYFKTTESVISEIKIF